MEIFNENIKTIENIWNYFCKIFGTIKIFKFGTIGLENMWKQILGQWNLNHQKTI